MIACSGLSRLQHVQQHRREPEHGVDDLALRGRDLVLDGVVGAEDEPVAVDQQQGRAMILSLLLVRLLLARTLRGPPLCHVKYRRSAVSVRTGDG